MINMLIDNYRKTLVNINDDVYTIDAKSLLYAKIVQMQLINLTGSKGLKSKSIMGYVRVLEREEDTNFEKYYKDLMFLDTILDRDVNIAENYDITIELSEKLTSRLEEVIQFLGTKNLPSKSGDLKLSLSQIRELNKKGEKGRGILDPYSVEVVEVKEEPVVEETTIIDVEHEEEEPVIATEVKEPVIKETVSNELDDYVKKIVEMIDSKMRESLSQIEKTVNSSDEVIKNSVKEVNHNIKVTIDNAVKRANDSIADTVSGSLKSITDVIENSKRELVDVKVDTVKKPINLADSFVEDDDYDLEATELPTKAPTQSSDNDTHMETLDNLGSSDDIFGQLDAGETTFDVFNQESVMDSMD